MANLYYTLSSASSTISLIYVGSNSILSLSSLSSTDGSNYTFSSMNIFDFKYNKNGVTYGVSSGNGQEPIVVQNSSSISIDLSYNNVELLVSSNINVRIETSGSGFVLGTRVNTVDMSGGDIGFITSSYMFPIFGILPTATPATDIYISPYGGGKVQVYPALLQGAHYSPILTDEWSVNNGQTGPYQMSMYSNRVTNNTLYYQTLDTSGYAKNYISKGKNTYTLFKLDQFITKASNAGISYTMPYKFYMKTFIGDWYDAALEYRNFSETAPWVSRGKMDEANESLFSSKLKNTSIVFYQKPRLDPASNGYFNANLDRFYLDAYITKNRISVPMSNVISLQLGWNTSAFDDGYPYFSAQGDFFTTVDKYAVEGGTVIPYVNPVTIDDAFSSIPGETLNNYRERNYEGGLSPGIHGLHYMNPRNPGIWSSVITSGIYDTIVSGGVGGLLFDVLVAAGSLVDYSDSLTPSIGGKGNTGLDVSATAHFLNLMRSRYRGHRPDFVMMSEGISENFVNTVDLVQRPMAYIGGGTMTYAVAAQGYMAAIPMWESIYHEYVMTMDRLVPISPHTFAYALLASSYVPGVGNLDPAPASIHVDAFKVFFSHYLHTGQLPCLGTTYEVPGLPSGSLYASAAYDAPYYLITNDGYPGQIWNSSFDFIRTLLSRYEQYKPYILFGRRMRPLNPDTEITDYMYRSVDSLVSTSVWKASDNTLGVLITNAGTTEVNKVISLSHHSYGLSGYNTVEEVTPTGFSYVADVRDSSTSFISVMPAESIRLYRIYNKAINVVTFSQHVGAETSQHYVTIAEAFKYV